jgi:hypothetical protein
MATKRTPGVFDCYENAETDEPMFILLGRDPMAGILIRLWVALREEEGEDRAKLEEALRCAATCEQWAIARGKLARVTAAVESLHRMAMPASLR